MALNFWDYAIIILYIVILVGISRFLRRRASGSLEDYFLAGRKMPWWALGISNMAFWLDMTGTMIITSFLYLLGPRGLYIEFRGGACLVLVFLMLWLGKWHRRSGVITGAEWMVYRFGKDFWGQFARIACVLATVLGAVGMLAYALKGSGLFLSMFLPFSPLVCTLLMLLITTLYTIESGFYGVVFSDIFQSLCIGAGIVYIVVLAVSQVAHCPDLAAIATSVTGNTEWTTIWPKWRTQMPKGYENYSLLTFVMLFYLFKVMIQGFGVGAEPRYFGAKSDRDCGLLTFEAGWLMVFRWPLMLGIAILGLFLVHDLFPDQSTLGSAATLIKSYVTVEKNQWPDMLASIASHPDKYAPAMIDGLRQTLGTDWSAKLSLLSYQGTVDPERILPAVILYKIPIGLRGLLLVALLAAAMSTFNCTINTATGFWTRDVYQAYLRPKASLKELIYASYGFGAFVSAAGFVMCYFTTSINDIWGWITAGLISGLMMPFMLRFYWWRFNGSGFVFGTIIGMIAAVLQRIFIPAMSEWYQFIYIATTGLVGSIIGTYVTGPTDSGVLENFYRTTRPFGFWKPLKNVLPAEEHVAMVREHRNDLTALPFTLGWQVTALLLPMQLMIRAYQAFAVTLVIFAVSMVGVYKFCIGTYPRQTGWQKTNKWESGDV